MYSRLPPLTAASVAAILTVFLAGCASQERSAPAATAGKAYYTTKTPYAPRQDIATYEAAPAGYVPVFTQLVARHGSRGLSGVKSDMAMLNLWNKAQADDALTPLGRQLGPDIMALMKANALLGYGIDGITNPGYGNLSQRGIDEHRQLARRLHVRMAALFDPVAANAASAPRKVVVLSSGVDRAKDSAANFTRSLVASTPGLAPLVQDAGSDRFMLYFHALKPAKDGEGAGQDATGAHATVMQASQAYQAYLKSPDYLAKLAAAENDPDAKAVSRAVLGRMFSQAFLDKIDNGSYKFDNAGSLSFASADGKFTPTIKGNGKTVIASLPDAAAALYAMYVIAPGMRQELSGDFDKYIPADQAMHLAYLQDLETFYKEGPSFTESGGVTYRIAQLLEADFFDEVDAIARGRMDKAAKLRFAHAETIVPFVALLGIPGALTPLPKAQTYTYENNAWRGELVAPMAANVQWDVYRNGEGRVLVRMLHNEKETAFKSACDGARIRPASYFYDYSQLRTCYGRAALAR